MFITEMVFHYDGTTVLSFTVMEPDSIVLVVLDYNNNNYWATVW